MVAGRALRIPEETPLRGAGAVCGDADRVAPSPRPAPPEGGEGMTVIAEAKEGHTAESSYAWIRLAASVALSTLGGVGMWSVVVVLPVVQAEFGTARAGA